MVSQRASQPAGLLFVHSKKRKEGTSSPPASSSISRVGELVARPELRLESLI